MKKYIKISPLILPVAAITYFLGFFYDYILMFLIISLHEISHLIAIRSEKTEVKFIRIEPFGVTIRLAESIIKNPAKEITMAAAGPLCNFLMGGFGYMFFKERLNYFILANLSMGIFNLIPAYPLDGGRILKAALSKQMGYLKSYSTVLLITKILAVISVAGGLYILYTTKFNFSVCLTGCFLLFNVFTEKNHSYFYLMQEISSYKEKNKDIEKMPIREIAVNKNFNLRKILSDLSFTRYYIFTVIEKGRERARFTEGELIEALIKYGGGTKINDLI